MEVLGIWDNSEDKAAMAVRLIVDSNLFNPPADINWFEVSEDRNIESFLRQMFQLRDQLLTPEGAERGYELYRAALQQKYKRVASAMLYIIKSASAPSALDISEELNRKLNDEIQTLNKDIVSTLVGRIIKADDFNQFDSWIITGTIEALNLKGFTEQANRLYTASQAETCQAINQVRFEITGETE